MSSTTGIRCDASVAPGRMGTDRANLNRLSRSVQTIVPTRRMHLRSCPCRSTLAAQAEAPPRMGLRPPAPRPPCGRGPRRLAQARCHARYGRPRRAAQHPCAAERQGRVATRLAPPAPVAAAPPALFWRQCQGCGGSHDAPGGNSTGPRPVPGLAGRPCRPRAPRSGSRPALPPSAPREELGRRHRQSPGRAPRHALAPADLATVNPARDAPRRPSAAGCAGGLTATGSPGRCMGSPNDWRASGRRQFPPRNNAHLDVFGTVSAC